jgi:hypothetical protein
VTDILAPYPDDCPDQSAILTGIIGTARKNYSSDQAFNNMPVNPIDLSMLKALYEAEKEDAAVNLLSQRHSITIDDEFRIPLGTGQVIMNTDDSMIDFHLTVANSIGFSSLLPNAPSDHRFAFDMSLRKPYVSFKGKHAMLGFDPARCMLFIGRCHNEDVFLAMAPNTFLRGHIQPCPPGHSSASSLMSRRHYRQVIMMILHFLAQLPQRSYPVHKSVYNQDLDSELPRFDLITEALYVFWNTYFTLYLIHLPSSIVAIHASSLTSKISPISTTSSNAVTTGGYVRLQRIGRSMASLRTIRPSSSLLGMDKMPGSPFRGTKSRRLNPGSLNVTIRSWRSLPSPLPLPSSMLFFLLPSVISSIPSLRCMEIDHFVDIPIPTIIQKNPHGIYDGEEYESRRPVILEEFPLLDRHGREISIYDHTGRRIPRRKAVGDERGRECGVLVDLNNIEALFDPYASYHKDYSAAMMDDLPDADRIHVDAYPLGFLRTAGNIQANGIPPCFQPLITSINKNVRKRHHLNPTHSRDDMSVDSDDDEDVMGIDRDGSSDDEDVMSIDRDGSSDDEDAMSTDRDGPSDDDEEVMSVRGDESNDGNQGPTLQAVKPVSAQMYNYISHRVATHAGNHEAQHGNVTAAISGAFANNDKDKATAMNKQAYCEVGLPSERFHEKIVATNCPTCCRAEFVYSIDIRALKNPSGRLVFFPSFRFLPFPSLTLSPAGPYLWISSFL